MKTTSIKFWIVISLGLIISALLVRCKKDFLDITPRAEYSDEILSTKKGIEGLLIGCYSMLSGREDWYGGCSNWFHGSVLGGDANKGADAGDQSLMSAIQRFEIYTNNYYYYHFIIHSKWRTCYEGISRANATLRLLAASTDPNITGADRTRISGEARFLRAHYYFDLKRLYNNVPFVDEKMSLQEAEQVPNTIDIWPNIETDFKYAFDNLPETQLAPGRANKWAAGAYLAKTYLYEHKFAEAKALFDQVIANGKTAGGLTYGLLPKYADLFNAEHDNNQESVFANQAAVNTGTQATANFEFILNFPYGTGPDLPVGCCGFFQPSLELGNAFRTDANGLPLPDGSYNDPVNAVKTDLGIHSAAPFTPDAGNLDPRIDHSIGRRGIPYLDWQDHPGDNWIRGQWYGGPYSPKKFVYYKSQESTLTDGSSWTRGLTAINYNIIRFADILLLAAEAEVELGNLEKAREYVNLVRARAANPDSFVKRADGSNAASYVIGLYNTPWTDVSQARNAVRFERKIELSGEGHRFFDLVRWGIAAQEINAYLNYEGAILTTALGGAHFTPNKNEYYPIPKYEIDLRDKGVFVQNPGY